MVPRQEDIDIARAQVKQAQLSQLQAENTLANSRIVAPFGGIVSQVNIKQGEQSATGRAAIVLTDLSGFTMKVLVDEIDVRQVAVGQPVRLERGCPARRRNHRQGHRDLARQPPTSTTSWPTRSRLCLTRPMHRCVRA